MTRHTRRHLLTRLAPGLALAALLPACGRPLATMTTTAPGSRAARPAATPSPGRSQPPATPAPATAARTPSTTAIQVTPTPTVSSTSPVFLGRESCPGAVYLPNPKADDPYFGGAIGEGAAIAFADRVRESPLILLGTVRDILPARWATDDGRRPANPHYGYGVYIYTPIRVQVERVAKGAYDLPDIYLAEPGGQIGPDCASYSGSGRFPSFEFGQRYFYLLHPVDFTVPPPVPEERRYRSFRASASYGVGASSNVTIGPERDILGGRADDPPRTLTVDEVFREIATLSGQPGATPTR